MSRRIGAEDVEHCTRVVARTIPGVVHDAGEVIAWTDQPQVCIRRPDGSTFWWLASLCEEAVE